MFADNREKYLGYAEAVTGIGLMLGPVLGGPLYSAFGYFESFAIFAALLLLSMLVVFIITPGALNQSAQEETPQEDTDTAKKVSFSLFLLNKRSLFAFASCSLVCFFMSYQSSFLTEVLRVEKGIPEIWNGPILALPCLTYTISCILVNYAVGRVPRRILILISFLMLAVSMVMQGPSQMLGLPDNNILMLAGFALNGIAQGFIFIPLLPDALEAVFIKERILEGKNEQLDQLISDYGSGLYGTFFSTG